MCPQEPDGDANQAQGQVARCATAAVSKSCDETDDDEEKEEREEEEETGDKDGNDWR